MEIRDVRKYLIQLIAAVLLLIFSIMLNAQQPAKTNSQATVHLTVYRHSLAIGDVGTAISSLHYLIASDTLKYAHWQDTLALLYVQGNAYQQAFLLADALLATSGYTDLRMEIKAISAKALQQTTEAITAYGVLYNKTRNPAYGFEQLQLQYAIRRLSETLVTGNSLLQNITAAQNGNVAVVKPDGKSIQNVSLRAAISNIVGLAYIDMKDKTNAMAQFETALKESPDFELAKTNLTVAKAIGDTIKKE